MATLTPETDIANALASALSLTVGTDIKIGPLPVADPGSPTSGIWVAPSGGHAPLPLVNAGVQGSYYKSAVRVFVRGDVGDYADALSTARACRDALHTKQTTDYVAWLTTTSEPVYLCLNEAGQYDFVVRIRAEWKV